MPEFDPDKFTPGCVPPVVKKGASDFMIVVTGVKDIGLFGGYWGNTENLGSRRRSKPPETLQLGQHEKSANSSKKKVRVIIYDHLFSGHYSGNQAREISGVYGV